jgi:hypothetical protein
VAFAQGTQGGARRGTCRYSVVDDDDGAILELGMRPVTQVTGASAADLRDFGILDTIEVGLGYLSHADDFLVSNHDGLGTVHHGARCKLGLLRYADLSDYQQVQRGAERLGHLECDGNAAARQGEDDWLVVAVPNERFSQAFACIGAIQEAHHHLLQAR